MKFHLDGNEIIKAPLERTYASLTDPNFMASAIPDLQSYHVTDGEHFDAKIRVGISIVRGNVDMKFTLLDKVQNAHARLIGDGSGAGSKMRIDSSFDLSAMGEGTGMKWASEAELSGLISGIGSQILRGQSEKQVTEIFKNIKNKLEESSPS